MLCGVIFLRSRSSPFREKIIVNLTGILTIIKRANLPFCEAAQKIKIIIQKRERRYVAPQRTIFCYCYFCIANFCDATERNVWRSQSICAEIPY